MSTSSLSRRSFVGASPLLLAALARCTASIGEQARFAEAFIVDPDWTAYRPVLRALIRLIVPLDDPRFPRVPVETFEERLISMFPLEKEQRFLGLQRTLTLFDQIDLFPVVSGPLLLEEEKARDGGGRALAVALRDADGAAWRRFVSDHAIAGSPAFTELPFPAQEAYWRLWRDSESVVKREFHSTMKSLVMITVYSADEVWPAIGYGGPLLQRGRRAP
jgi:hypothetical protein